MTGAEYSAMWLRYLAEQRALDKEHQKKQLELNKKYKELWEKTDE